MSNHEYIFGSPVYPEYDESPSLASAKAPDLLSLQHEELLELVGQTAAESYLLYAEASGQTPQFIQREPGSCLEMSFILQQMLLATSIETQRKYTYRQPFIIHHFLQLETSDGSFYVDPTWQQFLPKDTADFSILPSTLVLPATQPETTAHTYGVPERWQGIWTEGVTNTKDLSVYKNEKLNEIFARQGWY